MKPKKGYSKRMVTDSLYCIKKKYNRHVKSKCGKDEEDGKLRSLDSVH